jgi:hypothetical protein
MGGGYSKDIKTIINAHANTYRTAQLMFFWEWFFSLWVNEVVGFENLKWSIKGIRI